MVLTCQFTCLPAAVSRECCRRWAHWCWGRGVVLYELPALRFAHFHWLSISNAADELRRDGVCRTLSQLKVQAGNKTSAAVTALRDLLPLLDLVSRFYFQAILLQMVDYGCLGIIAAAEDHDDDVAIGRVAGRASRGGRVVVAGFRFHNLAIGRRQDRLAEAVVIFVFLLPTPPFPENRRLFFR